MRSDICATLVRHLRERGLPFWSYVRCGVQFLLPPQYLRKGRIWHQRGCKVVSKDMAEATEQGDNKHLAALHMTLPPMGMISV